MNPIQAASYQVVFNENGYELLNNFLDKSEYSKIFILTDSNTNENCLSLFLGELTSELPIEVLEIEPGEENKTITTCTGVWEALSELDADRKGLIINLGGGVVTDLGGFVASTFKRGMDFVNIPTSLLAMVDASIGGKTGVDLGALKNLVGVINNPQMVLIDTAFLSSLPQIQLRSGLAEMLKHGLIADKAYWKIFTDLTSKSGSDLDKLIYESVLIKNNVVLDDPTEKGLRKTLNYGHTLGHAIESYCLESTERKSLLHGEAIAIGMILESYLSFRLTGLTEEELGEITTVFNEMYESVIFAKADIEKILAYLKYDKKNSNGQLNFVLLEAIAKPVIDQQASNELIYEAFEFYTMNAAS